MGVLTVLPSWRPGGEGIRTDSRVPSGGWLAASAFFRK